MRGIGVLGLQAVVVRGCSLAANIVLAHLLAPRAFGIIALATAITGLVTVLSDGGIGVALIRAPRDPDRLELASLLGVQLTGTTLLAIVAGVVGSTFGEGGRVIAVIGLSMPLAALSSPGAILLERRLGYTSVAAIESLATFAYIACAIALVALGAGVWGLAIALVTQALVRSLAMLAIVPEARLLPRLRLSKVKPYVSFGLLCQASTVVDFARDQTINTGTLAIRGLTTLGVWTMVGNLAQAPFTLFAILGRVAFPTIARLMREGVDLAPEMERSMELVAVVVGLLAAGFVGTGPVVVPLLLGSRWDGVIPALPYVGLAILVTAPANVVLGGYLLARKRAGTLLWANVVEVVVDIAVAFALLPWLGVRALGIGFLAGGLVDMPVFAWAVRHWAPVRVVAPVLSTT
ncbi:MAG: oligosaccharide flippase family protein, partial [Acidimicrobiales bacterium]